MRLTHRIRLFLLLLQVESLRRKAFSLKKRRITHTGTQAN